MDFERVKTAALGAHGRFAVGLDQVLDVGQRQLAGLKVAIALRQRTWADDFPGLAMIDAWVAFHLLAALPRQLVARLASGVAELDADRRPLRLGELHDARQLRHKIVLPQPEIPRRGTAARVGLGRLDEDQPGAAGRKLAVMDVVEVVGVAVGSRIGQHRRHHDTVAQGDAAQLQRREQQAFHLFLALRRFQPAAS
jgi:hypothetical protein